MINRLLLLFFLVGCVDKDKTLPQSTGKSSEIIFVVDDLVWQQSVRDLASSIFEEKIEGLNQHESLFELIQINNREFKSILQVHKNIVIVALGVKEFYQQNKWASNQFVAQLNPPESNESFLKKLSFLKTKFVTKEIQNTKMQIKKFSQQKIEKKLLSNFGINFLVPNEYRVFNNELLPLPVSPII